MLYGRCAALPDEATGVPPGMDPKMNRSTMKRNETRCLDDMLDLPLGGFRLALRRLSESELATLRVRLDLQQKRHRLARGEFGIARHRAPQVLALLARRETALRSEREERWAMAPAPIQLTFSEAALPESALGDGERLAA